ncbi:hypothetical protein IEE94_14060 [Yimella sp. cx-573]|nr:hypothetical protein [Yimella sp. cx-573]
MNHPNREFDRNDSFDSFFRPSGNDRMDDVTDPGVPGARVHDHDTMAAPMPGAQYYQQPSQGSGHVEPPQEPHRKNSALLPLLVLGASLLVLAVVGFVFLTKGDAPNDAAQQTQLPTQTAPADSSSNAPSSSSSSTSSSSSSTSSSSSSSTSLSFASLPADQGENCSSVYTTSNAVTCGFADRILAQAQNMPDNTMDRRFSVTSPTTKTAYPITCNRPSGQYITCTWPGNSGTGYMYILPSN